MAGMAPRCVSRRVLARLSSWLVRGWRLLGDEADDTFERGVERHLLERATVVLELVDGQHDGATKLDVDDLDHVTAGPDFSIQTR